MSKAFVTMHIQKDRRITLGTVVHMYKDCSQLKSRTGVTEIAGPIVQLIPKCWLCSNRLPKHQL